MHEGHVGPFGPPLPDQLLVHVLDHVVLFGMNQQHGVQFPDPGHEIVEVPGADHAGDVACGGRTDLGGEDLESGKALLHSFADRVDDLWRDGAEEHHMVGVVGIGIAPPDTGPLLKGPGDVQTLIHHREVQQGGGASEQRGAADLLRRSRQEIAAADDRSGDVSVRLDAARDHDHPRGVNGLTAVTRQDARRGDGHDLFSLDRHVPHPDAHGCDDSPSSNDQVQHFRVEPLTVRDPGSRGSY